MKVCTPSSPVAGHLLNNSSPELETNVSVFGLSAASVSAMYSAAAPLPSEEKGTFPSNRQLKTSSLIRNLVARSTPNNLVILGSVPENRRKRICHGGLVSGVAVVGESPTLLEQFPVLPSVMYPISEPLVLAIDAWTVPLRVRSHETLMPFEPANTSALVAALTVLPPPKMLKLLLAVAAPAPRANSTAAIRVIMPSL